MSRPHRADVVMVIEGDTGQTEGLKLTIPKVRDGVSQIERVFSLKLHEQGVDEDGDPITQRTIDWGGAAAPTKRRSTDRQERSAGDAPLTGRCLIWTPDTANNSASAASAGARGSKRKCCSNL